MGTRQREETDLFRFPASRSPSTVELMVPSAPSTSVSQVLDSSHSAPPRCFLLARGLSPRVTCKSSSSSVTSPTYSSSESAMFVGKSGERKREDPSGRPRMVQASDGAPLENILPISSFTESQVAISSKPSFFGIAPTIAVDG